MIVVDTRLHELHDSHKVMSLKLMTAEYDTMIIYMPPSHAASPFV